MSRPLTLDTSLRFRLPSDLASRFAALTPDVSARLRYLMERDLKERVRPRRRHLPEGVLAITDGGETEAIGALLAVCAVVFLWLILPRDWPVWKRCIPPLLFVLLLLALSFFVVPR